MVKVSIRVLVVDDAPFIREVLRQLLVQHQIEVVGEAVDGQHAVELALQTKPDVILMDIIMPRKSGIEATKEILESLPQTKIIACSTADQQTMVLRALDAGCCEYVVKPFRRDRLIHVIESSMKAKN
jgi:two-component system chemotaxis response regulator CheY